MIYNMNPKQRNRIKEENWFHDLLATNPRLIPSGCTLDRGKFRRTVGVIRGDVNDYHPAKDILDYHYFDSWKQAYEQLHSKHNKNENRK